MPALDFMTTRGFKSIDKCDALKLAPINIVIGPHGAGKSNFLKVSRCFMQSARESCKTMSEKQAEPNDCFASARKSRRRFSSTFRFKNEVNQYDSTLEPTDEDERIPTNETCYFGKNLCMICVSGLGIKSRSWEFPQPVTLAWKRSVRNARFFIRGS